MSPKVKSANKRPPRLHASSEPAGAYVARPQVPMLVSCIEKIVGHINEQYQDQFRLQYDGRTVSVEMLALDSQIVLSSVQPLRPQLVEEFARVSMFFGYLAQVTNDDDWGDEERDAYETYETWGRIVHGKGGLIV